MRTKVKKMLALHKVDMRVCYAKQKISLACSNCRVSKELLPDIKKRGPLNKSISIFHKVYIEV